MFLRYFDKVLPIPKVGPNPKLQGCLPNELFARISHRVDERVIDLEVQTVDYTVDCDGIKTCLKCSTLALFPRLACLVCPDEPLLCIPLGINILNKSDGMECSSFGVTLH